MSIEDERIPDFPTKTEGEAAYRVARTTVGAADLVVPLLGQGLQHLMDRFVGAPLEQRREVWFNLVGRKLQELADRPQGFDFESLERNEDFLSAVADATQAAMRTHHELKREALANVVANTAAGAQIDEILRGAFIASVTRFSPFHFQVLASLDRPDTNRDLAHRAGELLMANHNGASLGGSRVSTSSDQTLARVVSDLFREEMIDPEPGRVSANPSEVGRKTTSVGRAFLKYVGDPSR